MLREQIGAGRAVPIFQAGQNFSGCGQKRKEGNGKGRRGFRETNKYWLLDILRNVNAWPNQRGPWFYIGVCISSEVKFVVSVSNSFVQA